MLLFVLMCKDRYHISSVEHFIDFDNLLGLILFTDFVDLHDYVQSCNYYGVDAMNKLIRAILP